MNSDEPTQHGTGFESENTSRRRDRLGVHSIGEFMMTVPSLDDASRFYGAFGLDVRQENGSLVLRVKGHPHIWGRLRAGGRKKFGHLTLHCFEDEFEALLRHAADQSIHLIDAPPQGDGDGFWIRSPDGLPVQIRPGLKTTPDVAGHQPSPLPVDGVRSAPYRGNVGRVLPRRLSHIALFTKDVDAQVDFFTRVLGLRLSDRAGDRVAFLHAPHGGDHHLIALVAGSGPGLHHLSWDVPSLDEVGMGSMAMADAGYTRGWGVGRHVLGSNYFHYVQDPWGSFSEYSATMDYIPASVDWIGQDHPMQESFYLWGPEVPPAMLVNSEEFLSGEKQ